jgi:hypothetical protein
MSQWNDIAHFAYGQGFWYADPIREIHGLSEDQLFRVPGANAMCILWQVGHIAHRERLHLGVFLQGFSASEVLPPARDLFGHEWCGAEEVRQSVESVADVLDWVREVREESHAYIDSLGEADFHVIPDTSENGLTVAHWLWITACHTALHIGRIQLLRALVEGTRERAC